MTGNEFYVRIPKAEFPTTVPGSGWITSAESRLRDYGWEASGIMGKTGDHATFFLLGLAGGTQSAAEADVRYAMNDVSKLGRATRISIQNSQNIVVGAAQNAGETVGAFGGGAVKGATEELGFGKTLGVVIVMLAAVAVAVVAAKKA